MSLSPIRWANPVRPPYTVGLDAANRTEKSRLWLAFRSNVPVAIFFTNNIIAHSIHIRRMLTPTFFENVQEVLDHRS